MFLSFSFQDESRETKWKISCYPEISFSSETNFENESIKKRVKYFSPLKKKNETKRTSRIKSGRFRLIFSRRRMEWRLTPGTRLSRENPHAASISDWIFPISNLGFSREKPTNQVRFFFFFYKNKRSKNNGEERFSRRGSRERVEKKEAKTRDGWKVGAGRSGWWPKRDTRTLLTRTGARETSVREQNGGDTREPSVRLNRSTPDSQHPVYGCGGGGARGGRVPQTEREKDGSWCAAQGNVSGGSGLKGKNSPLISSLFPTFLQILSARFKMCIFILFFVFPLFSLSLFYCKTFT